MRGEGRGVQLREGMHRLTLNREGKGAKFQERLPSRGKGCEVFYLVQVPPLTKF